MKNAFKRFTRFFADLALAFNAIKSNLLSSAFPRPAYQRVPVPIRRPEAIRYSMKG